MTLTMLQAISVIKAEGIYVPPQPYPEEWLERLRENVDSGHDSQWQDVEKLLDAFDEACR